MNQKQPTQSRNYKLASEQVRSATPVSIIELISRQLDRADDAKERIDREGSVVRDMKGSVIAHPAIAIEKEATKLSAELLGKYAKR